MADDLPPGDYELVPITPLILTKTVRGRATDHVWSATRTYQISHGANGEHIGRTVTLMLPISGLTGVVEVL